METKKIRIYDNGHGLLISVKDIISYLEENGVIGGKKPMGIKWKFYTEIFDKLKHQYKVGTTTMQINIFDFQDMFICWTELWLMKKYFTDMQRNKKAFRDLFLILDSPHEIKESDLFKLHEIVINK